MDHSVRQDITAAAGANRDLGPGFEDAVAEGLVERIGAEIDKRVDARLGQQDGKLAGGSSDTQLAPAARSAWEAIILALGSMTIGGILCANVLGSGHGGAALVGVIWVIIGVVNVAYARRR